MYKPITSFKDLKVWEDSINLHVEIYKTSKRFNDFEYKDQIRRASLSVPTNIAEGFDRSSLKDYIRFLFIAKSSNSEVRSLLESSLRVNLINKEEFEKLENMAIKINGLIYQLIQSLQNAKPKSIG